MADDAPPSDQERQLLPEKPPLRYLATLSLRFVTGVLIGCMLADALVALGLRGPFLGGILGFHVERRLAG